MIQKFKLKYFQMQGNYRIKKEVFTNPKMEFKFNETKYSNKESISHVINELSLRLGTTRVLDG